MERTDRVTLAPCGHDPYCNGCAIAKVRCGVCNKKIDHRETLHQKRKPRGTILWERSRREQSETPIMLPEWSSKSYKTEQPGPKVIPGEESHEGVPGEESH